MYSRCLCFCSCLIWTLCMLFKVVTIDFRHYMADRQERFDLKISHFKLLLYKDEQLVFC